MNSNILIIKLIIDVLEKEKSALTQIDIFNLIKKHPDYDKCDEILRVQVPLSAVARNLTKYSSGVNPVLNKIKGRRFELLNKNVPKESLLKESDIHPALVEFVFHRFNVFCKTVNALKIIKKRNNEINKWANPDIVGVNPVILKLNNLFQSEVEKLGILSTKVLEFYSFELKLKINKQNLTESYFQAVSNSSWANFGYLVVADLDTDTEFISNLIRLNNGYGIGVIHLNINNPKDSQIIVSARDRDVSDINFMNFLSGVNKDFFDFINTTIKIVNDKKVDVDFFDQANGFKNNELL